MSDIYEYNNGNEVLHETDAGAVEICECGSYHFTFGAVTLHLDVEDVADFVELATALLHDFDAKYRKEGAH